MERVEGGEKEEKNAGGEGVVSDEGFEWRWSALKEIGQM